MRILALAHGLGIGGAQISTLEFLEGLRGRLDLKLLVCSEADENFASNATSIGIGVYHAPCRVSGGYPIMDVNRAKDLIKWADIAWITDVEYLTAPLIKQIRSIPVIAHIHSYALICPWWGTLYSFREPCLEKCSAWRITRCKQGINLELAKIGLLSSARARLYWLLDFVKGPLDFFKWSRVMNSVTESIDGFIAVSKALWEIHARHLLSLSSKPFSIVYNPVTEPLKHVKPDPHEPYGDYVLYASGSNPVKGPHLLLEAWREVSREFRDLKLYMVGCKSTWVERKAHQMALRNIVFMERLPPDRRYYYLMYKAKAVVMPSLVPEAFGRIPVEANRLGVPAIISSAGALPEIIIDDITGYIFKAGDVDDLVKKVVKVLEKDFNREEIIKHSYEKVNPQREVENLIKFFESVMNYKG
jgi:glycosyltransferase involved in cell wall biosynthesis